VEAMLLFLIMLQDFIKKKYLSSKDATKNEESDIAVFNKEAW
jgi:hypothetical protein